MTDNLPAAQDKEQPTQVSIFDNPDTFLALGDKKLKPLKKLLRGVLTNSSPRVCGQVAHCLFLLATGTPHMRAMLHSSVSWHRIQAFKRNRPQFVELYGVAVECQKAILQHIRVNELHKRGVEGWLEPVFYKGKRVGVIRKKSDKMLELALKAEEPDKYSDRQQKDVDLAVSITFIEHGVDHSAKQPPLLTVEAVEALESAKEDVT